MAHIATLRVLLAHFVAHRIGATPAGSTIAFDARTSALAPDVQRAVHGFKSDLLRVLGEDAIRRRWRMPPDIVISPIERVRLAWLAVEYDPWEPPADAPWQKPSSRYSPIERAERLDLYMTLVANGLPQFLADIESTHTIVCQHLLPSEPAPVREAAA